MSYTSIIILFLFGSALGSFLNVFSLRYDPEKNSFANLKNVLGRSKCSYCKKKLKWYELIPLFSFFLQLGKCRSCSRSLSWQYPIIEGIVGLIFVIVPVILIQFYGSSLLLFNSFYLYILSVLWVAVFLVLLAITIIDIRHYIVPNELNISLFVLGLLVMVAKLSILDIVLPLHDSFLKNYALIFSPFEQIYMNHILGAFVGALFFTIFIVGSRGRAMGWGDAKLGFSLGIIFGWPEIGLILLLAFIMGGFVGALLIVLGRKKMSGRLPFAPFLAAGSFATFFAGYSIIKWYFSLFGM